MAIHMGKNSKLNLPYTVRQSPTPYLHLIWLYRPDRDEMREFMKLCY
jgi:hypothetical protein